MRNSSSPGYCERTLMDAPTSTCPAVISSTVPRFLVTPLYAKAVRLSVVVDISPNSTVRCGERKEDVRKGVRDGDRETGEGGGMETEGRREASQVDNAAALHALYAHAAAQSVSARACCSPRPSRQPKLAAAQDSACLTDCTGMSHRGG